MAEGYCIVMTTAGDAGEARSIARALVEAGLVACVQLVGIDSVYAWEGEVTEATEVLLLAKMRRARYDDVEAAIRAAHSYQVPEIVMVPIESGLGAYLGWIDEVTTPS